MRRKVTDIYWRYSKNNCKNFQIYFLCQKEYQIFFRPYKKDFQTHFFLFFLPNTFVNKPEPQHLVELLFRKDLGTTFHPVLLVQDIRKVSELGDDPSCTTRMYVLDVFHNHLSLSHSQYQAALSAVIFLPKPMQDPLSNSLKVRIRKTIKWSFEIFVENILISSIVNAHHIKVDHNST